MGGRNQSECPAGMDRNRWPESIGISGRNASEYAAVNKLKQEIENLFIELEEDQNYSSEWKVMHSFLRRIINR